MTRAVLSAGRMSSVSPRALVSSLIIPSLVVLLLVLLLILGR
jgi:hypothetical protein